MLYIQHRLLIALQCFVGFCQTSNNQPQVYICPLPLKPPSHLPHLWVVTEHCLNYLCHTANSHWLWQCMFQCYCLNLSHLLLLLLCLQGTPVIKVNNTSTLSSGNVIFPSSLFFLILGGVSHTVNHFGHHDSCSSSGFQVSLSLALFGFPSYLISLFTFLCQLFCLRLKYCITLDLST